MAEAKHRPIWQQQACTAKVTTYGARPIRPWPPSREKGGEKEGKHDVRAVSP
jgi:hypothetical protein